MSDEPSVQEAAIWDRRAERFRRPAGVIAVLGMLLGLAVAGLGVVGLGVGPVMILAEATQADGVPHWDHVDRAESTGFWLLGWAPGAVYRGAVLVVLSAILRWLTTEPEPVVGEVVEG